jgi:hypothetical protein
VSKRNTTVLTLGVIATALVMLSLSVVCRLTWLGAPHGAADGALQHPVVTDAFLWVSKPPAGDALRYLVWTALLMAPFAVATGWMLTRMAGRRAFLWAAAPALALYGAYHWDLVTVCLVVWSIYAWSRGRPTLAGALLGLGAAIKIYPGFFLLPLVIERLVARDVRGAIRVAAAGVGTWLVVNLPFMVVDWEGWSAPYRAQLARAADLTSNSVYFWFAWGARAGEDDLDRATVDHLSLGLIVLAWIVVLALGWFHRPEPRAYPWVQVSAGMLCAFLAFNKVYSPHYLMWLLPFFALIRVRWGWWAAASAIDLVLFVGVSRWYDVRSQGGGFSLGEQLASMAGWSRVVLFTLLLVVLPRARTVLDDPEPPSGPAAAERAGIQERQAVE